MDVPAVTSILGIDISSFALHGCLLVDDQPPILRMETLGKDKDPLIERLRRVPLAVSNLTVPTAFPPYKRGVAHMQRPDWVVIEEPAGKYGTNALRAVLGAITASIPAESQVGWRKASEWRSDLGCANTKAAGHHAVRCELARARITHVSIWGYDEHELDAIGIALAWQRILAGQEAA